MVVSKFWSLGTTLSRKRGVRVREETAARNHESPNSPGSTSVRPESLMNRGLWHISYKTDTDHALIISDDG